MAALLRSQDGFDLETAIREWQSRQNERQHGGPAPEPDEKSAVARLTAAVDTLFREIVVILCDKGKFPRDIFISLDRSRSCFSLWSDGHGVASGGLDDSFQRSGKLRHATIRTLSHLSTTLIDGLLPVAHVSNPKTEGLCDQVNNILEEVKFSHVADDSSSDSTSGYSTADIHELAEDLKTDVDCLIELDQVIRDPATDLEPETKDADVSQLSWTVVPHQAFVESIEKRFPKAGAELFSSLGMVNYDRFLRCQGERERNQLLGEQTEQAVEITGGSKFHDSGLGSSLNPASSYAETIMSYRDGNRSVKIPPLPEQAKGGKPFPCVACGRSITMTTNSQWKRHLYFDLQPYVCLDTSCQRSDSTFSSRANWIQHLALDHSMEPGWEQIRCPLCGDEAGPGKIAITTHMGRHLEEISLLALPKAPDSETNSETSDSDRDDVHEEDEEGVEMLQDPEAVQVESEAESREQQPVLPDISTRGRQSPKPGRTLMDFYSDRDEPWAPVGSDYRAPPTVPILGRPFSNYRSDYAISECDTLPGDSGYGTGLAVQPPQDLELQIHNGKEAAFHRRMGDIKNVQEYAKKEVGKARAEVKEAADKRLKAGQKAEEEDRARLYAQAIAATEEVTYKRTKAGSPSRQASDSRVPQEYNEIVVASSDGQYQQIGRSHGQGRPPLPPPPQSGTGPPRTYALVDNEWVQLTAAGVPRKKPGRKPGTIVKPRNSDGNEIAKAARKPREPQLRLDSAVKAVEDHRKAEAEAHPQAEKEAREKIAKARELASELVNGGSGTEESHETTEKGQRTQPMRAPALTWDSKQEDRDLRMHTQWISEQQRRAAIDQNEIEVRKRADEEARLEYEARLENAGVRDQFRVAQDTGEELRVRMGLSRRQLKVQEGIPRQQKESDRTASFEPGQHLDEWQTQPYRWICPSCGSKDQDRRKGPVCSNCSYLVGDGDGLETLAPEPLRATHFLPMTEEQIKQHLLESGRQAASTYVDGAPQTVHQDGFKHAEQSVPDSTTNNHENVLNDEAKDIPPELSLLEPSVGIDSHTAALKNKLNPIRLSTVANRPLSDLDLNDSQALPRIQLGNTTDIHNTIPSLNEDPGLVEGLRDHDRDWSLITDEAEQRRRANRMAQRAYRLKLKKRLEDLERRAGAADGQGSDQAGSSEPDGSASHHTPMTGARFDDSVPNDGDYLKYESWPFPRPL